MSCLFLFSVALDSITHLKIKKDSLKESLLIFLFIILRPFSC